MEKYPKISNKERAILLTEFCQAISALNNIKETLEFLTDLLTKQEIIMLAKRIKTAKFLIQGKNYREIQNKLNISQGTIAKINHWLLESGEGFRLIEKRTQRKEESKNDRTELSEFQKLKKRYPIMFWPQLIIEDIVKEMNRKQKEKVKQSIKNLDRKSQTYKQINKILKA